MRRKIFTTLIIISLLSLAAAAFSACSKEVVEEYGENTVERDGILYRLNAEQTEYSVSGSGDYAGSELRFVSSIDGIPVTKIANKAFNNSSYVTGVHIPSSISIIGENAFSGCKKLERVSFEDDSSLISIGDNAFARCSSLTEFNLPDSVEYIGECAFSNAENLSSIVISSSSGLKTMGDSVFSYCKKLRSIYIPKGVAAIPDNAFCGCDKLSDIRFADDTRIESIGFSSFAYCNGIISMEFPHGIKEIGKKAFSNCFGIVKIDLPETLLSIGDNAFEKCYKLVEVRNRSAITVNVKSKKNGFAGYYALSVYDDPSESRISFDEDGFIRYLSDDGVTLLGRTTDEKDMTVPDDISVIYKYAFYGSDLENLTLNDGLKEIGARAFENCDSLYLTDFDNAKYVASKNNPYFLLYRAKDTSISTCTIHEDTEIINGYAFANCAYMRELNIPAKVRSFGGHLISGNRSLSVITVSPENEYFHSEGNCLIDTAAKTMILGCKTSVIPSDGSVTAIGDYAFEGCYELSKIVLPESLTSIGYLSFSTCPILPSIRIPASVVHIDIGAFYNCTGLVNVYFNDEEGWAVREYPDAEPVRVNVSTTGSNVTRLRETYLEYVWEKN